MTPESRGATDAKPEVDGGAVRIPFDELVLRLSAIFAREGVPAATAALLARNVATAERDGSMSHGVFRMPAYVATLRSGYVDAAAVPAVEEATPAYLRVDAANGFAQPALAAAADQARQIVQRYGVAVIAIRRSHHLGALWIDVEPFSRDGVIALTCVSGISRVAPHGGNEAFYGINPMAFAVPRANAESLIFDQASAAMAWGEIRLAAQERRPVAPGTGLDRNLQPTTDPAAILDGGVILTFGGHKSSSISMMVELLAAALTGGDFSFEVDRSAHPGAESSRSGQFVLLIDPRNAAGRPYVERVEALIVGLRAAGQARLPGDRRRVHRKDSTGGVQLTPANRRILQQLATSGANPL